MGTYVSNAKTETPTHWCWVCKKVFIFDEDPYGTQCRCLHCDGILTAYYDAPPSVEALLKDVALVPLVPLT